MGELIEFDLLNFGAKSDRLNELVTVLLLRQTLQKTTQRERIVLLTISGA